jgi:hypothetical protein
LESGKGEIVKKELLGKLVKDQPLTAPEAHELDQVLEKQEEMGLAHLVRRTPSDEPSLAWRSSLNQALAAQRPAPAVKKRNPFVLLGTVLVPAAAAVALAFLMVKPGFTPMPQTPEIRAVAESTPKDLESALLLVHRTEEARVFTASTPPAEDGRYFEWSELGSF